MAVGIDWFGEGDENSDLIDIYRTMETNELFWMSTDLKYEASSDPWTEAIDAECLRRLAAVEAVLEERGFYRKKRRGGWHRRAQNGDLVPATKLSRGLEPLPPEVREIVSHIGFRMRRQDKDDWTSDYREYQVLK